MKICDELLAMYHRNFLSQFTTIDEEWVYWDNVNRPHHDQLWWAAGDQSTPIRRCVAARNHLATIVWDVKGILLCDGLPQRKNKRKNLLHLDEHAHRRNLTRGAGCTEAVLKISFMITFDRIRRSQLKISLLRSVSR